MSLQDATEQGQKKADDRAPESKDWQMVFDILPIFGCQPVSISAGMDLSIPTLLPGNPSYGNV